ncbi:MAG: hypothetical protein LH472_01740 [Pyrinomonadaceae bacterium]|nr:hypothetical protein [Pyrinomonadaceae bacterium]
MKKFLAGFVVLFMLLVALPFSADAQNRGCRKSYSNRNYGSRNVSRYRSNRNVNRYRNSSYNRRSYGTRSYVYEKPSFYRRHRNLVNLGAATGGGALIGALLGGKRGALIGTAIGAGSGALYTYGLNKKKRRYNAVYVPRYRNR